MKDFGIELDVEKAVELGVIKLICLRASYGSTCGGTIDVQTRLCGFCGKDRGIARTASTVFMKWKDRYL